MNDFLRYNENDLLQRISQGDESAFRALYDLHWNRIYTIALMYLKSPDAAMDVVQDVFLKLWTKRGGLDGVLNFSAWLHTIARNLVMDRLRRESKMGTVPTEPEGEEEKGALPDQQLIYKETAALIQLAIKRLPPRQQTVYRLAREQGLKRNEIAAHMAISPETVREHMNSALKTIRAFLRQHIRVLILLLTQWLIK